MRKIRENLEKKTKNVFEEITKNMTYKIAVFEKISENSEKWKKWSKTLTFLKTKFVNKNDTNLNKSKFTQKYPK